MDLAQTLLHPQLLLALSVYALAAIAVELIGERMLQHVADTPLLEWKVGRIFMPLGRAAALLLFILLSYPLLFGITDAPALGVVLAGGNRISTLLNLAFLLPLVLPLLPGFGRLPAVTLPLQAIAIAGVLFSWVVVAAGIERVSYWPGTPVAFGLLALAIIGHQAARALAHGIGEHLDMRLALHGAGHVLYGVTLLMCQTPVVLLYTLTLGRQLSAAG